MGDAHQADITKHMIYYLLYEVNVVKSTMRKLGSTTREGKVFTTNFNPILVSFKICKLGVGNIMVPDLWKGT